MVFVIFGFKRYVTQLAVLTLICGHCSRPTAHPVRKVVTRFTLFFIPLFPTSTKLFVQCTYCGFSQQISKDEADRLVASPATTPVTPAAPAVPPAYRDEVG